VLEEGMSGVGAWMRLTGLLVGTVGCVSTYRVPELKPIAQFTATAENDESPSTTTRSFQVWVYKDESCQPHAYGKRAGWRFDNSTSLTTDPTPIAAGERFLFTAYYSDSRFARNRACAVTGAFTPLASHRYHALLEVEGDVSSCKLGVYDATSGHEERIDMSMPKYVCEDGKASRLNGQPLWLNWEVR
jgi:hypothetical protein